MPDGATGEHRGIGASLRRKEDDRHLRGRGQFVADIELRGTQEVVFLRSPHAHAMVRSITVPPNLRARVFTAADLPDVKPIRVVTQAAGARSPAWPVLATDKVRFVGEAVAACMGPTRAEALDAAAAVAVDYQPLPAVVDAVRQRAASSPLVHDSFGDNLFQERTVAAGDIDVAMRAAAVTVRREYRMHRQSGAPMECRGVLACRDHRLDEVVVYASTQTPHTMRVALGQLLGMEQCRIRVVAPDVGGGFGPKARLYPEELVLAALAMKLDHPVRWIEDRNEHLLTAAHSRDHHYVVTAYADAAGHILGIDCDITVDAGAYGLWPQGPYQEANMAARCLPGPYTIPHYRARTWTVATNKAPMGPYRGVGRPGACFAIERTIDEVARAVGRDPVEVRIDNMIRPEQMPYVSATGMRYDNGDYPASVRLCASLLDLPDVRERQRRGEQDGRLIGIGFASFTEQTAHGAAEFAQRGASVIPGFESCTARILPDGGVVLMVGIQSHGQGLETALSQIACEELGIDPSRVAVRHGDTESTAFGFGTFASRSMVMSGGAVARASRVLREKLVRIGAHLLQCDPAEARCERGSVVGPVGEVSIAEIAAVAHLRMHELPPGIEPLLEAVATYEPSVSTGVYSYATHGAVVAVDVETGAVDLLDFAVAEDCGTMVNPMLVEGQIRGGVVQGIGTALCEAIPYDAEGQPLAATLLDYHLPWAGELPAIKIGHLHTAATATEYGMKGMGEGGAVAPPAAIANAVRDAFASARVEGEVNETPVTGERVVQAAGKIRGG
ncbi:MAG TPA: xanthine dehydrogenase family protein molybdopterin-binding subunit [Acetobacteraceae bacterium]|jgi:aerobic carbon-monoxide dehydrogenase large subunit|nr:xanthine dehydrogenase family protein molybdopterin-binding subunit [Acetobacteraceae bacterium]